MGAVESQLRENGLTGACCSDRRDPADKKRDAVDAAEVVGRIGRVQGEYSGPWNSGEHGAVHATADRRQAWKTDATMSASFASKDAVHHVRHLKHVKEKVESDLHRIGVELEQVDVDLRRKVNELRKDPSVSKVERDKENLENRRQAMLIEMGHLSKQLRETIQALDESEAATIQGGADYSAPALFRKKAGQRHGEVGGIIAHKQRSPSPQALRSKSDSHQPKADSHKRPESPPHATRRK